MTNLNNKLESKLDNNERQQYAIKAAKLGFWELDPVTVTLEWDARCQELFGLPTNKYTTYNESLHCVHPEDLGLVNAAFKSALAGDDEGNCEVRFRTVSPADGRLRWVQFSGSAAFEEKGKVARLAGIAQDVTGAQASLTKAEETLREKEAFFRHVTRNAPTGLWLSDEAGGLTYLNETLVEWTGMAYTDLLGAGWANAIIEGDRERSARVFLNAVTERAHYDTLFRIKKGNGAIVWCRAGGDPFYREDGSYAGYAGYCMDIDELVKQQEAHRHSEERFRNIVEQSPMAIGLLRGREMVVELGNDAIFQVWGKTREIVGKDLLDALPEIRDQIFMTLLQEVYDTGKPFFGTETLARLERNGQIEDAYFNFVYTPVRSHGGISGVMVLATEVTGLVTARKIVEESEKKLKAVIDSVPAAIALFVGPDLVVDMPNQAFLEIAAQGREITGKPLREAMPELIDQPFLELLDNVYNTGEPYEAIAMPGELLHNGVRSKHYFNFFYIPLFDNQGKVFAILDVTLDVTQDILNKKQIEESEAFLKEAVEVAELATWSIDAVTYELTYSHRLYEWYGVDPAEKNINEVFELVEEGDRQRVQNAILNALSLGSDGIFDEEFTIRNHSTNRKMVIHSQGKLLVDQEGNPIKLVGTAQDITVDRQAQLALEQQIQVRTEELDASNEELQAANEELAATNEELSQANDSLHLSNQDLQQFAHVASHDLKEPLRKIRTFLGRLEHDPANVYSSKSLDFMTKINTSVRRMQEMIEGVLSYSKFNAGDQKSAVVSLTALLTDIINDLEVLITEKKASIRYGDLPTIEGSPILLYQLFYNLVVNALKFSAADRPSVITVTAMPILRKHASYVEIEFVDNGIGFEQVDAEKIFNTFTRLNPKDEYEGTGLGLALCKKIVLRHHGTIEAYGQKGKGARFVICLPKDQMVSYIK